MEEIDDLILYTAPMSAYCTKVRMAAHLKGLTLVERFPPEGYGSAAYRRIVPMGTIPALVHGGNVLTESDAIVEYLDDIGAGQPLMPSDPMVRARNREISRYADNRLELAARALYPKIGIGKDDPALNEALIRNVAALEKIVTPGPFLTGSLPSLADCALVPVCNVLAVMELYLPLPLPWPVWFAPYRAAVRDLPGVALLLDEQAAALDAWARARMTS